MSSQESKLAAFWWVNDNDENDGLGAKKQWSIQKHSFNFSSILSSQKNVRGASGEFVGGNGVNVVKICTKTTTFIILWGRLRVWYDDDSHDEVVGWLVRMVLKLVQVLPPQWSQSQTTFQPFCTETPSFLPGLLVVVKRFRWWRIKKSYWLFEWLVSRFNLPSSIQFKFTTKRNFLSLSLLTLFTRLVASTRLSTLSSFTGAWNPLTPSPSPALGMHSFAIERGWGMGWNWDRNAVCYPCMWW